MFICICNKSFMYLIGSCVFGIIGSSILIFGLVGSLVDDMELN